MIAARLVHLIETNSDRIAGDILEKLRSSPRTSGFRKIPAFELRTRMQDILRHLSEWLLTKTEADIEAHYREVGASRARQGIALADACWAVTLTREYLWEFLQKRGIARSPVDLYAETELLWLLDQFFDRALCYIVEGYSQDEGPKPHGKRSRQPKYREVNPAAWVP
jgi:hypothetical protein